MTRIALDAMGSDDAPATEVAGALAALQTLPPETEILLVGARQALHDALAAEPKSEVERITIVEAPDVIGMAEKPLAAVRAKPNSSLAVAMQLHATGQADAFVSAGNTGAILAAATLGLRLHEGVQRAAIGAVLPTAGEPVLLLDAGANVDCSAREYVGFAHLGAVYARDVLGRSDPSIGLLSIGEESEKGNQVVREAHTLLSAERALRFIGNVEGRDIPSGQARGQRLDVVVCDGFVGNVALKLYEATGRFLLRLALEKLPHDDQTASALQFLDWSEYGGAPLLGVKGVCIVCHGSSPPKALTHALRVAQDAVTSHLTEHTRDEFAHEGAAS